MCPVEDNPLNLIQELDQDWPLFDDSLSEADDHIREIKSVLKNNFPNFSEPLNNSSDELNYLTEQMGDTTETDWILKGGIYLKPNSDGSEQVGIDGSGLISSSLPLVPIGSLYFTTNTKEYLDQKYGLDTFIIPDGRLISENSAYYAITKRNVAPNVFEFSKSSFLRPKYGSTSEVGLNYPFKTKQNGLSLSSGEFSKTHDHGGLIHSHSFSDTRGSSPGALGGSRQIALAKLFEHLTENSKPTNSGVQMIKDYSHNHEFTIEDAGDETAPVHILMNIFMRIN